MKLDMKCAIGMLVSALCLAGGTAVAATRHAHPGRIAARAVSAPVPIGIPAADGRLFGHLPYDEAPPTDLVLVAPGFGLGVPCRLQRDAAADLVRLLKAADAVPGVAQRLKGISCYRTIAHQRAVFCRSSQSGSACVDPALRARSVGPPGFSEHATGYALDFGVRPSPGCADVDACIAEMAAGKWLLAHAPEFGFELSFPMGNAQGVTWEPWHWRWVGTSLDAPGAARARLVFTRARAQFPANPMVDAASVRQLHPESPPVITLPSGVY